MNNISKGILLGGLAGIIDVIPMILMKLPLSADISAFSMWVVIGLFISVTDLPAMPAARLWQAGLPLKGALKGILIALLILAPTAVLIAAGNPADIIPVLVMTIILGGLLGLSIERVRV